MHESLYVHGHATDGPDRDDGGVRHALRLGIHQRERKPLAQHSQHHPCLYEGKVLAQAYTQGVITKKGKVIDPRDWLVDNIPAAKDALEELETPDDVDSMFDEKSTRFMHLEEAMRKSAALHDEKVAK